MTDALSRVSSRYETVIPRIVRERLSLFHGDILRFVVTTEGPVILERAKPAADGPFAAFGEWGSDEDDWLYRDL